jgi:hypothetical protein
MRVPVGGTLAACALTTIIVFPGCKSSAPAAPAAGPKNMNIGGTLNAAPSGGKFVITGRKGTYTVEMADAPVVRANKAIPKDKLKEGALVVVSGTVDGTTMKATKIEFIRGKNLGEARPSIGGAAAGG